jgi:quercetin dioxygenase-like cupin family protein
MNTLLRTFLPRVSFLVRGVAVLLCGTTVFAATPDATTDAKIVPLVSRALLGIAGQEIVALTVEYAPGASSAVHRHNATVVVYVLEGAVTMQVAGGSPVTLHPGDTFVENPCDIHTVSANASKSAPAKFLVVMVKAKDAPPTLSVAAAGNPKGCDAPNR